MKARNLIGGPGQSDAEFGVEATRLLLDTGLWFEHRGDLPDLLGEPLELFATVSLITSVDGSPRSSEHY